MTEPSSTPATAPPVCPRHPDQVSYVRCQRCNRPVCPSCQRPAPVGVQCVDCVAEGARTVRQGRTVFGGQVTDGRPVLTFGIMGVTAAVYVLQMLAWTTTVGWLAFSPHIGDSEPWRFLTSALVHGSVFHIGVNMYALFIIGSALEPALGRARYLSLYALGALGGSAAVLLLAACSSPVTAKRVSPVSGLTATKYSQSPGVGSSTACIAASPGELTGPGGRPATL